MDLNHYGVLSPYSFFLVIILIITWVIQWRGVRMLAETCKKFNWIPTDTPFARAISSAVISTLLITAVMRPFWGTEDIEASSTGNDVIFLVDISRSMYAQDVLPSRMELAKRKIKDLVAALAVSAGTARFGITVFAGDGYTVCPVTNDRGVLSQFIDIISPDLVSSLGSNLQAGITAAVGRTEESALKNSRIIVLSDGEDNFLELTQTLRELAQKGVRVDSLGIGTPSGGTVTLPNGALLLDSARRPVTSTLNETSLRAIAQATGGVYVRATLGDDDVQALARQQLAFHNSTPHTSHIRTYREIGPWLVSGALFIVLAVAWSPRFNPLIIFTVIILMPSFEHPRAEPETEEQGPSSLFWKQSPFDAYMRGDFETAAGEYSQFLQRDPHNRNLLFGLASSLYQLGQYQESAVAFSKLAENAPNGREYFDSKYNEANSLLALGRYSDAIDAYWSALDVKPDDEAARNNLAIARALLEQQQRATPSPTPTPTPTALATQQPSDSPEPSPQPKPSPDSEQDSSSNQNVSPSPSAGTPDVEPSPPNKQPNTTPSAEPGEAVTPDDSSSPTDQSPPPGTDASPSAIPHQSPPSAPSPDDRLKEAVNPSIQDASNDPLSPTERTYENLTESEAWLDSLPDSPLLIRKYRGTPASGGQTW